MEKDMNEAEKTYRLGPAAPAGTLPRPGWDAMVALFKKKGALTNWTAQDLTELKNYVMHLFCTRYTLEDVTALNSFIQLLATIETASAAQSEEGSGD